MMNMGCGEAIDPVDGDTTDDTDVVVDTDNSEVPLDTGIDTGEPVLSPLRIGITFHLEGWEWDDPDVFDRYVNIILPTVEETLDDHGAVGTFEVHVDLLKNTDQTSLFSDMAEAGHGVSLHADLGGSVDGSEYTDADFVADLIERAAVLESQIGQRRGASGICSDLDWITAAREAGFEHVTGNVAYCNMAMDPEFRPPEYPDCPHMAACHGVWPEALADRIEPWRLGDVNAWTTDDPAGEVVDLPSSGTLSCFAENRGAGTGGSDCVFDDEDIDAYLEEIDAALAMHESGHGEHMHYVVWSLGRVPDEQMLGAWLSAIEPYVAAGRVRWSTTDEMMDAWLAASP